MVLGLVPTHDELLDGLQRNAFRPFEDGLEEERIGWCDWRNLLITPPDEGWLYQERFAVFGLRLDNRKVPGGLLKAHVDLKIENLQQNNNIAFLSKEARISLQHEVNAELLFKVLPTPKVLDVAWDLKGGVLLTTASSGKSQSALTSLFIKSFGCELQPMTPLSIASRLLSGVSVDSLAALTSLDFNMETA
jgi:DNA recombination-dependent growth factor C